MLASGCARAPAEPATPPTPTPAPTSPARGEAQAAARYAFPSSDRRAKLAQAFPAIDEALTKRAKDAKAPGFAFALTIDGEIAHVFSYGIADKATGARVDGDTRFRMGSISKTFTALALAKLREDGKLASFESPLEDVLPEARALRAAALDGGPVRIRDLTLHQSGLARTGDYDEAYKAPTDRAKLLTSIGLPALATPYEGYGYSNYGYGLLGLAVENLSGAPFTAYVDNVIARSAGLSTMAWSSASVPPAHRAHSYAKKSGEQEDEWQLGTLNASGGLFLSAPDAARWAAFHADAFPPRDAAEKGPVRRSTIRELLTVGTTDAPNDENRVMSHSVLGWDSMQACGDRVFWKSGLVESFISQAMFLPDHGIAFASMANTRMGLSGGHGDVLLALRATGALERREKQPSPELVRGIDSWLENFNDYDAERFERAYTADFIRFSDAKERAEWTQKQLARIGRCERKAIERVEHAGAARFVLACERGSATISISLDRSLRLIAGSSNQWRYQPTRAQHEQAAKLFASLQKKQSIWGNAATPEQKASEALVTSAFRKLRSCSLGPASETTNPDETLFRMQCADDEARLLRVSFAEDDAKKVVRIALEAAPPPASACKPW
jgi:CubicO group peptidase (beta-lactamase class C family)